MSLHVRLVTLGRFVNSATGRAVTVHYGKIGMLLTHYWVRRNRRQYVTEAAFATWQAEDQS